MAKAKKAAGRKLKVFQAQIGFHDMVVAVPSQAAALRAWDVGQNLFAQGAARPATDPQAIEAARAHPGIPLMRPAGSDKPFGLHSGKLPKPPAEPRASGRKTSRARKSAAKRKAPPKPPPPPDRRALDAAEAALREVEEHHEDEKAEIDRLQAELDDRRSAFMSSYLRDRRKAAEAVTQARRDFRKAGGIIEE